MPQRSPERSAHVPDDAVPKRQWKADRLRECPLSAVAVDADHIVLPFAGDTVPAAAAGIVEPLDVAELLVKFGRYGRANVVDIPTEKFRLAGVAASIVRTIRSDLLASAI